MAKEAAGGTRAGTSRDGAPRRPSARALRATSRKLLASRFVRYTVRAAAAPCVPQCTPVRPCNADAASSLHRRTTSQSGGGHVESVRTSEYSREVVRYQPGSAPFQAELVRCDCLFRHPSQELVAFTFNARQRRTVPVCWRLRSGVSPRLASPRLAVRCGAVRRGALDRTGTIRFARLAAADALSALPIASLRFALIRACRCIVCQFQYVPEVLLATIELPPNIPVEPEAQLIQARIYKPKRRSAPPLGQSCC